MRYFCTLFDSNYLIKGHAMLTSLIKNCSNARIYVLCMDDSCFSILKKINLSNVVLIKIEEFETDELRRVKKTRGVAEYCWTLSPCLPKFVFVTFAEVDFLTYLDADLFFYSSIDPIFEEIADSSIAIIGHRFSERLKEREINGKYCVEWVCFKRDLDGIKCLDNWRRQCIDWCYNRLEDGKMGDQKYLDDWPELFDSCHVIENLGSGVAPWNFEQYEFSQISDTEIYLNRTHQLIFYHFHQFQILDIQKFNRIPSFYTKISQEPDCVYSFYEFSIKISLEIIRKYEPRFKKGFKTRMKLYPLRLIQRYMPNKIKNLLKYIYRY